MLGWRTGVRVPTPNLEYERGTSCGYAARAQQLPDSLLVRSMRHLAFDCHFSLSSLWAGAASLRAPAEQRADALLKQMTLEEKIGQLNQAGGLSAAGDSAATGGRTGAQGAGGIGALGVGAGCH